LGLAGFDKHSACERGRSGLRNKRAPEDCNLVCVNGSSWALFCDFEFWVPECKRRTIRCRAELPLNCVWCSSMRETLFIPMAIVSTCMLTSCIGVPEAT